MSFRPIRKLLVAISIASFVAAAAAVAQERQPGAGTPERGSGQAPPGRGERGAGGGQGRQLQVPNVSGSMKGMNRAAQQLAEQMADASKKDENLKLINDMQRGCVNAKGQPVPNDILEHFTDPAAKAKAAEDYRHALMKALRLMVEIEADIDAGRGDAAKPKLEEIAKLRDDSHKTLGVSED